MTSTVQKVTEFNNQQLFKITNNESIIQDSLSVIKFEKLITLRQNTSIGQKNIKTEKYNHTVGKDNQ